MKHLLLLLFLPVCALAQDRLSLDLSGEWNSSLGTCQLPGTTDENHLGDGKHRTDVTSQLTRLYPFTGVVDYERTIEVSADLARCKHLTLWMERTKPSTLWVDGDSIGHLSQVTAPHAYVLPRLKAGKHTLRIRIDNSETSVPKAVQGSHAWTDATQTNWNGILGRFVIEGTGEVVIDALNVYPDIEHHQLCAKVDIQADRSTKATVRLKCGSWVGEYPVKLEAGSNALQYLIDSSEMELWSEFHPTLHTLQVEVAGKRGQDQQQVRFGIREFGTVGTQMTINGFRTFLRGTHDGCVFPQTGYCPTDKEEWLRVFGRAKEYGINHVRFHSYTPTEAAFEAADSLGIYLQTELPIWGSINANTEHNEYMLNEARTLLRQLGNHPSFMALGLGNELWGDFDVMRSWLDEFRSLDSRHLYVYGSNNTLGWQGAHDGEDYMVTCRVGGSEDFKTNTRVSFSFADETDGGILNHDRPNTRRDFSYPVSITPRPIVAHETAQYQMYPDYRQIADYKGVLYPYNLEIFRSRLEENGLSEQATEFTMATTAWGLDCYKADIEYCVRTPKFGGYQLLDLKDYPGQGSALCGILDANMKQKSKRDRKVVQVMQPLVVLGLMDSHCYSTRDTLHLDVVIANYLEQDWEGNVYYDLVPAGQFRSSDNIGKPFAQGRATKARVGQGQVRQVLHTDITFATAGTQHFILSLVARGASNQYDIWVYDEEDAEAAVQMRCGKLVMADTLDASVVDALQQGRTVLLTPRLSSIEGQSVGGLFTPDYWNYAMFRSISLGNKKPVSPGTLGLLVDRHHTQMTGNSIMNVVFPHDCRTDWQWWCITKQSRPLILDQLDRSYFPLIQAVDNVERNHKLGILMGFRVGKGRLLLSTTDLQAIQPWVEGRSYARALKLYATSREFRPKTEITLDALRTLLYSDTEERDIQGVKNITDYNKK